MGNTNALTVAVCMRGHSQRSPVVEFNVPGDPWTEVHFWLLEPHTLYASTGKHVDENVETDPDLSAYTSWFHAAFTLSEQVLKLYVDGDMKDSHDVSGGALSLPFNIRVGMNPNNQDPTRYIAIYTGLYKTIGSR